MHLITWADPDLGQGIQTPPHGRLQVTICFLRNTATDHLDPVAYQGRGFNGTM